MPILTESFWEVRDRIRWKDMKRFEKGMIVLGREWHRKEKLI